MAIKLLNSAEVSTTLKVGTIAAVGAPLYSAPNSGLTPNLIVATPVEPVPNSSPGVLQLMCMDGTISSNQEIGRLQFAHKDDATTGYATSYIRSVNQNTAGTGAGGGGNLRFGTAMTNTGASIQDRMTIRYNGNVGVGITTPGSKFVVDGDVEFMDGGDRGFYVDPSTGEFELGDINGLGDEAYIAGDSSDLSFYNSGSLTLNIDSNNRVKIGAGSASYTFDVTGTGRFTSTVRASNFILSSDERLKTKIKDLEPTKIDVDWKSFEMKEVEGDYRTGVIAQDLEKSHPEFVGEDEEGFKSVKYIDLLIAKISELESRLAKLEK
jgi:uncharacterized protein YaiE (UPF0345 family)